MAAWKMPPKAKVYEALSAVADRRVTLTGPTTAQVVSSSRDKAYDVTWSADMRRITSNDNASYWQGYIGYPIIAVLLKTSTIPFSPYIAGLLAGIPWKQVNDQFMRDYNKAVNHVLDQIEAKGGNRSQIIKEVERIYQALVSLALERDQQRRPQPQGSSRKPR